MGFRTVPIFLVWVTWWVVEALTRIGKMALDLGVGSKFSLEHVEYEDI